MRRPAYCCTVPAFHVAWDRDGTDVTLHTCDCWPHGDEVDGMTVWESDASGEEAVVAAVKWVLRWADQRGGRPFCAPVDFDRAVRDVRRRSAGVLVIRVTTRR